MRKMPAGRNMRCIVVIVVVVFVISNAHFDFSPSRLFLPTSYLCIFALAFSAFDYCFVISTFHVAISCILLIYALLMRHRINHHHFLWKTSSSTSIIKSGSGPALLANIAKTAKPQSGTNTWCHFLFASIRNGISHTQWKLTFKRDNCSAIFITPLRCVVQSAASSFRCVWWYSAHFPLQWARFFCL